MNTVHQFRYNTHVAWQTTHVRINKNFSLKIFPVKIHPQNVHMQVFTACRVFRRPWVHGWFAICWVALPPPEGNCEWFIDIICQVKMFWCSTTFPNRQTIAVCCESLAYSMIGWLGGECKCFPSTDKMFHAVGGVRKHVKKLTIAATMTNSVNNCLLQTWSSTNSDGATVLKFTHIRAYYLTMHIHIYCSHFTHGWS